MRIILASASPRRRELLEQIGLKFEIKVSSAEEKASASSPGELVEKLSLQKAEAVLAQTQEDGEAVLVIGADTVVAKDGKVLGKPVDEEDAARMLRLLAGQSHQVYTGVTLLYRPPKGKRQEDRAGGVERKTFHETTEVYVSPMTESEIAGYVASKDPMDKAGAYGIQGFFARYVQGIRGDYNNVVGLPVGRLYREAKEWLLCEI